MGGREAPVVLINNTLLINRLIRHHKPTHEEVGWTDYESTNRASFITTVKKTEGF